MRVTPSGYHSCPGGCHAQVPNERFACPDDWARLPFPIRDAITRTSRLATLNPKRREALESALAHYRLNPIGAPAAPAKPRMARP